MSRTKGLMIAAITALIMSTGSFYAGLGIGALRGSSRTAVTSFNDGFTDGMRNAHELGPAGTAAWLAAPSR